MGYQKRLIEEGQHSNKLSSAIKRTGGGVFVPELSMETMSEIAKYERAQDKEDMKKFNKDVEDWATLTKHVLRYSIKSKVKRNVYLSDSLKANIYHDEKYGKEVNKVGFSFAREGIYIHKGAGRGQGGYIGGRWINRHGQRKQRAAESAGLQGTGNRKPIEWFDPVVESRLPRLFDIILEYSAGMMIASMDNLFIGDR